MDILELMRTRHSVRKYQAKAIEPEKQAVLTELANQLSEESGIRFLMVYDEPECFKALLSRVMTFRNCTNYIAIVGKTADPNLEEKAGYYGKQLVLKAQELGLGTCWVGLTRGKPKVTIAEGEKLSIVIALGYGANTGFAHKNKPISTLSALTENLPDWYARGLEGAMLAPTAVNQQKFYIAPDGDTVTITAGNGAYSKMDLGIVKYHFEAASGRKVK